MEVPEAVRLASDEVAGVLTAAERRAFDDHLADCESCSSLRGQLRATVAVLGSRRSGADSVTLQLPQLYALAEALDPNAADDLVQETLARALAKGGEATPSDLAAELTRLAGEVGPDIESPVAAVGGTDPDADTPELFYPALYSDGPDAGAWVDATAAWGEARVLPPEADLLTTEVYGVVDSALAELDPVDAGLITLVDIEGAPFGRAVLELDLSSSEARERLARARFEVRSALDRHLRG